MATPSNQSREQKTDQQEAPSSNTHANVSLRIQAKAAPFNHGPSGTRDRFFSKDTLHFLMFPSISLF
jgi:hypothetical protein